MQLPPEWTDQFASGIQVYEHVFFIYILFHLLHFNFYLFMNLLMFILCLLFESDYSSNSSRAWTTTVRFMQNSESQYIFLFLIYKS